MNSSKTYRVMDVCADINVNMCYVYLRDVGGILHIVKLRCVYEIIVGSSNRNSIVALFGDTAEKYGDRISLVPLGERMTYYRGAWPLLRILCDDHNVYDRILADIRYNKGSTVFRCGGYSTIEDVTMAANGLYSSLYVTIHDNRKIVPAE